MTNATDATRSVAAEGGALVPSTAEPPARAGDCFDEDLAHVEVVGADAPDAKPEPSPSRVTPLTDMQRMAVEAVAQGGNPGQVARMIGVHRATVYRWLQHPEAEEIVSSARLDSWHEGREEGTKVAGFMLSTAIQAVLGISDPAKRAAAALALYDRLHDAGLVDAGAAVGLSDTMRTEAQWLLDAAQRRQAEDDAAEQEQRRVRQRMERTKRLLRGGR